MKLLPDGLSALLAPAAMLPALFPSPPSAAPPVVDPDSPVVLPADPVVPIMLLWAWAKAPASAFGLDSGEDVDVFEPGGCSRCRNTGYRGRVGLFEVMLVTEDIRSLIVRRASSAEISAVAVAQGKLHHVVIDLVAEREPFLPQAAARQSKGEQAERLDGFPDGQRRSG